MQKSSLSATGVLLQSSDVLELQRVIEARTVKTNAIHLSDCVGLPPLETLRRRSS